MKSIILLSLVITGTALVAYPPASSATTGAPAAPEDVNGTVGSLALNATYQSGDSGESGEADEAPLGVWGSAPGAAPTQAPQPLNATTDDQKDFQDDEALQRDEWNLYNNNWYTEPWRLHITLRKLHHPTLFVELLCHHLQEIIRMDRSHFICDMNDPLWARLIRKYGDFLGIAFEAAYPSDQFGKPSFDQLGKPSI